MKADASKADVRRAWRAFFWATCVLLLAVCAFGAFVVAFLNYMTGGASDTTLTYLGFATIFTVLSREPRR